MSLNTVSPRFGALKLDVIPYQPYPGGPSSSAVFQADDFLKALKPFIDKQDGNNPIDILDLNGLDVVIGGRNLDGNVMVSFQDKSTPQKCWGHYADGNPDASGSYLPFIARFFAHGTGILDVVKSFDPSRTRRPTSELLQERSQSALQRGDLDEYARLRIETAQMVETERELSGPN